VAVQILEAHEGTMAGAAAAAAGVEAAGAEGYEMSELLLYKATVLAEAGSLEAALELLERRKAVIKDRLGALELTASLQTRAGRGAQAAATYRRLLALNPDNTRTTWGCRPPWGWPPPPAPRR